jgi:hypothetical protein
MTYGILKEMEASSMKPTVITNLMALLFLLWASMAFSQTITLAEPAIHPLLPKEEFVLKQVIPPSARYLSDSSAIESYLIAMDGAPPRLDSLTTPEGVLIPDALVKLNKKRDRVRQTRRLIKQRLAFLWTRKLMEYNEEHEGFKLDVGPERYRTSWGEVFVRPERPPAFFIAVPSGPQKAELVSKVNAGVPVEVRILMLGQLKTIVYSFSNEPGMTEDPIPQLSVRINVDEIQYFLASDGK